MSDVFLNQFLPCFWVRTFTEPGTWYLSICLTRQPQEPLVSASSALGIQVPDFCLWKSSSVLITSGPTLSYPPSPLYFSAVGVIRTAWFPWLLDEWWKSKYTVCICSNSHLWLKVPETVLCPQRSLPVLSKSQHGTLWHKGTVSNIFTTVLVVKLVWNYSEVGIF